MALHRSHDGSLAATAVALVAAAKRPPVPRHGLFLSTSLGLGCLAVWAVRWEDALAVRVTSGRCVYGAGRRVFGCEAVGMRIGADVVLTFCNASAVSRSDIASITRRVARSSSDRQAFVIAPGRSRRSSSHKSGPAALAVATAAG